MQLKYSLIAVVIALVGAFIDVKFSILLLGLYTTYLAAVLDKAEKAQAISDKIINTYESHFIKQLWRYKSNGKESKNDQSSAEGYGQATQTYKRA